MKAVCPHPVEDTAEKNKPRRGPDSGETPAETHWLFNCSYRFCLWMFVFHWLCSFSEMLKWSSKSLTLRVVDKIWIVDWILCTASHTFFQLAKHCHCNCSAETPRPRRLGSNSKRQFKGWSLLLELFEWESEPGKLQGSTLLHPVKRLRTLRSAPYQILP